ncbi:ATP-dependent DNA ligase [Enterobacter phage 04_vB_Eclo_IJM]|nr:ATP-dependent DNA ligase [Enterobacter phage 04_vB_Eclo_IJM]
MWKLKPEDTIDGTALWPRVGTPGKANEGKVIGFEVLLEDGMVVNACGLTEEQKDEFTGQVFTWSGYETQERYQSERCDAGPYEGWQVEVLFMERFRMAAASPKFQQVAWDGRQPDH